MFFVAATFLFLMQDAQKERLYKAEVVLTKSPKIEVIEFKDVQAYVSKVYKDAWFKNRYPKARIPKIEKGKYGNNGYSTGNTIGFPEKTTNSNILHEIAHQLSPNDAGHGPKFARIYVDLVWKYMGQESAELLRKSFEEHNVNWLKRPNGS